ncbi:DUF4270 domain-containing protein [Mangrovimonas futianensis]|uniref:DUF4270 domain-containing protein n=1 Tax=Mangrovimonas futianensis TaxID=2895523 RepID=UPI001E58BAA1|nr:DUF4270 domain-containing protein [Mangrovimonas futianensis]MCF1420685.1 DUF4270 domain-containing protein [Mangrovimonas futianensis]
MKRNMNLLKTVGAFAIFSLLLTGCKKEFISSDSDLQGNHNFNTSSVRYPIATYNKMLNAVQTSGLPANSLGIYDDPVYGPTTNHVVTQIIPDSYNPDWGTDPVFDSIVVTIPYFSNVTGTDSEGNSIYELDSIFNEAPMKLSVYRSNYFLSDYDQASEPVVEQLYYSDLSAFDNGNNEGELLYVNENFTINPNAISLGDYERDENGEITYDDEGLPTYIEDRKIAPSLRLKLNEQPDSFWQELFFPPQPQEPDTEAPFQPELSNRNNFTNFFRGLYFKVEPVNGQGSYFMLNFEASSASVNLYYTNDEEDTVRDQDIFEMSFSGNRVSIIKNDPSNTLIENADANADEFNGDEQLFLKGGEGSVAIIDLFKDEAVYDDFISSFKDDNGNPTRLINEANMVFYVDQDAVFAQEESQEPERVILYDLKNNIPVIDYNYDLTSAVANSPLYSKVYHSTILEKDENGRGYRYKLRITEHLNNILLRDSTNFSLGLMVTTNILYAPEVINGVNRNSVLNSEIKNGEEVKEISPGTVLSPKGTILHGGNSNVPDDKRVELEIFYSEPDQN